MGPLQRNSLVSPECHCGRWDSVGLTSGPLPTVLLEHMWQSMNRCLACSTLLANMVKVGWSVFIVAWPAASAYCMSMCSNIDVFYPSVMFAISSVAVYIVYAIRKDHFIPGTVCARAYFLCLA